MLRIKHGEESKLTSWFFEIDRGLFYMVLVLMGLGFVMSVSAGSAEANRLSLPWYNFMARCLLFEVIGVGVLVFTSMLNKKFIKIAGIASLIFGLGCLIYTLKSGIVNGSSRWIEIHKGVAFMPVDVLKPALIIMGAWFLSKMREIYGDKLFSTWTPWKLNRFCWEIFLIPFLICLVIIFKQPDVGTTVLFFCIAAVMLFVAGLPWKYVIPGVVVGLVSIGVLALRSMEHIQSRSAEIFSVAPRTQVWYSINSIRHGGLIGSGDESYVKDVLPEAHNDFVYSSLVEDWGALAGCALILVMFFIVRKLFKHASLAKDDFVVYAVTGAGALFFGQIFFNLTTALHMVINKGMTLPFVSYGGGSLLSFCFVFGMVLALVREDTWD